MRRLAPVVVSCLFVVALGCARARQHSRLTDENPLASMAHGFPESPLAFYKSPQLRPGQNEECSLAVGLSGGGSISAAFAYGVLEYLSEHGYPSHDAGTSGHAKGRFLYEIDYYSTASGGGLTAALALEMLREFAIRDPVGPDFDTRPLHDYFGRARFRGVLDWRMLSTLRFAGGLIEGGSAAVLRKELEEALSGRPDEACRCRGPFDQCRADRPTCRFVPPLTFDDVFVPREAPRLPALPIWYATTTVFHSGHTLPVTPVTLAQLGVKRVRFGEGWFGLGERWVPAERLDMLDALTLSMAFPGIGPVLATTHVPLRGRKGRTGNVLFADGGQSDNLGLVLALDSVAHDVRNGVSKRGVVVIVDAALESAWPYTGEKPNMAGRLGNSISNALPLLASQRRQSSLVADALARGWLGERSDAVSVHFLRASELLDDDTPLQFCDLTRRCLDWWGFPEDRATCFEGARCGSTQKVSPRDRILFPSVRLELTRQEVEDLLALGRHAAERALQDLPDGSPSPLRRELAECFQQTPW